MPRDFKLEFPFSDGSIYQDLSIENKDLVIIDNEDELTQYIGIKLRFINGEWSFDITKGVKYFGFIFEKSITKNDIDAEFRNQILSTDGVIEITTFESDIDRSNRVYSLNVVMNTIYGDVTLIDDIELGV